MPRRPDSTTTPTPTSWPCGCCAGRWRCSSCFPTSAAPSSRRGSQIGADEIARWDDISRRMYVPFHDDGIISQFEGYERLAEFDWERYRTRYGNIQRLDLILEAENDSANRYKLSKQADVLMLFYLFSAEELRELFERLGYPLKPETIPRNVAYYDRRSSHGSTLVAGGACLGAGAFRPPARAALLRGSAAERRERYPAGHHARRACISAPWRAPSIWCSASRPASKSTGDVLRLNPRLPEGLERLDMRIRYRGHSLDLRLTRDSLTVRGRERGPASINLAYQEQVFEFIGGSTRVFELAPP